METQFQTTLVGLGDCMVVIPESLPKLTQIKSVERDYYIAYIYSGLDGFTYWFTKGKFTDEHNVWYKVIEILPKQSNSAKP